MLKFEFAGRCFQVAVTNMLKDLEDGYSEQTYREMEIVKRNLPNGNSSTRGEILKFTGWGATAPPRLPPNRTFLNALTELLFRC